MISNSEKNTAIKNEIKKLENRNLNLLKEMRYEICVEDKVPYRNTIVENLCLIAIKTEMIC